jgi:uncharacterized protein
MAFMRKLHTIPDSDRGEVVGRLVGALMSEDGLAAVFGFGSFFLNGPFHDIDIALLYGEFVTGSAAKELDLSNTLSAIAGYEVDVRILNGAPLPFVMNVLRGNNVLIDNLPVFRENFCASAISSYCDFLPFRNQYLKQVRDAAA